MPKTKELSIETRCMIITQHKMGLSNRKIAKNLKLTYTTVGAIVRKFRDTGTIVNKKRIGRPRKTITAKNRRIVATSKRNRRLTAPEIASQINVGRIELGSIATVKRRLNGKGLYERIAE